MWFEKASALIFSFLLLFSQTLFARTPLHDQPLESPNFRASLFSQGDASAINQMQQWIVHLEDKQGQVVENARIRIRGGMPEHDHGLPTAPQVIEYLGEGDYLIAGMKFHMAGRWQIELVVSANNQQDTLVFDFEL